MPGKGIMLTPVVEREASGETGGLCLPQGRNTAAIRLDDRRAKCTTGRFLGCFTKRDHPPTRYSVFRFRHIPIPQRLSKPLSPLLPPQVRHHTNGPCHRTLTQTRGQLAAHTMAQTTARPGPHGEQLPIPPNHPSNLRRVSSRRFEDPQRSAGLSG